MFSKVLDLGKIEASEIFDFLYSFFKRDFIDNKTYLDKIYINPRSWRKSEEKELDFWHLTTKEEVYYKKENNKKIKVKERVLDYKRAERIEWIKKIIENYNSDEIKMFYYQETNPKKDIRLYLWLENYDFVVILQKIGKNKESFLVTSFYISHSGKKQDFQQRYEDYINNKNQNLKYCEWF